MSRRDRVEFVPALLVGDDGELRRGTEPFAIDTPVGLYWLAQSTGFRVEGARRRRGMVAEIAYGVPDRRVAALVVRRRRRRVFVPISEIVSVDPWRRVVVVARPRGAGRGRAAAAALWRRAAFAGVTGAHAVGGAARAAWRTAVPLAREAGRRAAAAADRRRAPHAEPIAADEPTQRERDTLAEATKEKV